MDLWTFLLEIVMLLGSAFLLGALAQRLRQSPIVGYLLAGTILGPLLFNAEAVNQSAELGVSLLLFSIGLEFSFKRLRQMGRMAFGGGTLQVTATLVVSALLMSQWVNVIQAVTIGAIVALSSTAVVIRVLADRSEIDSVRGRTSLAILLLQDIAIVPLVLLISLFSPQAAQTNIFLHILKILAAAAGLGVILYVLLHRIAPLLLARREIFANRELTVLLSIAVALGASWGAHALGISPALGAFAAGILLGESPFAAQVRADIGALRTIMVTLFFASVGMLAKPLWFLAHIHWVSAAALTIFFLKTLLTWAAGILFGLDRRHALAVGITLGQIGEFSFVLAAAARQGGIIGSGTFDLIVSVIIILMFAAPYMVSQAFPLADMLTALWRRRRAPATSNDPIAEDEPVNRVLVVGLGPVGQEVARHLMSHQLVPILIDTNPQSRKRAFEMGIDIHLGDATNEEILLHAGLKEVCMAVVTVPDPGTALRIVEIIRQLRPRMPIAARCRYNRHVHDVRQAGADIAVDEETRTGHMLAHDVVSFLQDASGAGLACRMTGHFPGDQNRLDASEPSAT